MRNKSYAIIVIIFLVSSFICLDGIDFVSPLSYENNSAANFAFGIESGTAGLKYLSPYTAANNPAILGAINGMAVEFAFKDYYKTSYSTSSVFFKIGEFGISLPFFNTVYKKSNSGLKYPTFDFKIGEFNPYGEIETDDGKYQPVDRNMKIGIGKKLNLNLVNNKLEIFLGYSANIIHSEILREQRQNYGYFGEYGFLMSYKPLYNNSIHNLDLTIGVNYKNPFKLHYKYSMEGNPEPLISGVKTGFSTFYSLSINVIDNVANSILKNFSNNLFSLYSVYDYGLYIKDRKIFSEGHEISLLDIFSYRYSKTTILPEKKEVFTYSYGLNFMYKNKYGLAIDYVNNFSDSDFNISEKLNLILKYNY